MYFFTFPWSLKMAIYIISIKCHKVLADQHMQPTYMYMYMYIQLLSN